MIDALLFDFDGLILDTETTDFESWRMVYEQYGVELPREHWVASIGTDGSGFDPHAVLERLVGRPLDEEAVRSDRRARRAVLFEGLAPLPGVETWLAAAAERGLAVSIVSSSPRWWIEEHLARVGLRAPFEFLTTSDDVERVKPWPDPYVEALARHDCPARRAVAIEDSPNGLAAAKRAGLYCVAVPGPMTRGLSFAEADLVLDSLAARTLDAVLDDLQGERA